jgi:hypothetical protein
MMGMGRDGRTYKVKIEELLEHLKANREEHKEIVEEAQASFREQAIKELDKMLSDALSGRKIRMSVGLTVPTVHLDEFDNAIGLMEMTQRAGSEEIEITADEYEKFVQNRWDLLDRFQTSNRGYTNKI